MTGRWQAAGPRGHCFRQRREETGGSTHDLVRGTRRGPRGGDERGKAGERPGEDEEGDADNMAHLVCLVL